MCQEQVEKALQQSGKRITQQRKILLDVILNGDGNAAKRSITKQSNEILPLEWQQYTA